MPPSQSIFLTGRKAAVPRPFVLVWLRIWSVCLLAIASLPRTSAVADTEANDAPFLIKSWLTTDGLPQNTVQAIAQTPEGYLWVGTRGGLSRFDGVRFTSYGLADGLKSLGVKALVGDGQGGLWIATAAGLSRWRDGVIRTLTTADGLLHGEVYSLAAAEPGGVWIGTARGLQHWGPGGFSRVGEAEGLNGRIVALAASAAEGLWISMESAGLFRWHQGRCERVALPLSEAQRPSSMLVDAEGDVWAGMGNGIVLRRHRGAWIEYNESDGVPFSYVFCMAEGMAGEIWAGSHEQGLFVFRDGRFQAVPGTEASIRAVTVSRDGVVWVGTQTGGLNRLTPPRVMTFPVGNETARGEVNGLAENPSGQFWAATSGGGLHHGPLMAMESVSGIPEFNEYPFLRAVLSTSDGNLSIIGADLVGRRDAATEAFRFTMLVDAGFTAGCEDADGSLLLGATDGVLRRLAGGVIQPVSNGNVSSSVMALLRGKRPGVWVATLGAGLFHWDSGKVKRWTTAEGLPTNLLRALHEDAEGTLWIGTAGGGLAWLKDGRVQSLDSRRGLVNDAICPILEDDDGNLWLGSIRGISRVSKRELFDVAAGRATAVHPLALDESDGMPTAECTTAHSPAGLRTASGLLLFSTTRHIVGVDPKQFAAPPSPPEVRIESLVADGKTTASPAAEISLAPGPREVSIEYTAFNYFKPDRIRFRHRLEGIEKQWTSGDRQRVARYALLPPGRYTFEVNAANEDGQWHPVGASLAFTVKPAVWQTEWFRALAILSIMASGAALVWRMAHVRIRRAHERERLARAEAETLQHRNEIAHVTRVATLGELSSALAHEINQPLGAILRNAEAAELFLQNDSPDLDEIRAILADIRKDDQRAGAVIDRMRGLLQRHEFETRTLGVAELIGEVAGLLRADAAARQVELEISVPENLPPVRGDRVHLQQVLLNLVINAMDALQDEAPDNRRATIRARVYPAGMVEIAVSDNGRGIPAGKLAQIFDPFVTTKPNGMGMGLPISRTIVKAHGGELSAENNADGGATFRFTLPVAQEGAAA